MKTATPEIRPVVAKAYLAGTAGLRVDAVGRRIRENRPARFAPSPQGRRRSVFSAEELERLAVYIEDDPGAAFKEPRER